MARASEAKKGKVGELAELVSTSRVVAVLDLENIPANTMQEMRNKLRPHARIVMSKKRLMNRAFEASKKESVSRLTEHYRGMPALLLTEENPFRIASLLRKSRTPAAAKAGQIAPFDIIIPAGPTPFPPGPIISELGSIGIKTGVEQGKVAVKEPATVAKAGEPIPQKVADVLARLDMRPMEVGLTMTAAYEDGVLYEQRILEVDEQAYIDDLNRAASEAFAVALGAHIMNAQTAPLIIARAARDAFALAMHESIPTRETAHALISRAYAQARALKSKIKEE